ARVRRLPPDGATKRRGGGGGAGRRARCGARRHSGCGRRSGSSRLVPRRRRAGRGGGDRPPRGVNGIIKFGGKIDADVCIIGAGEAGLAAALAFARRGLSIVVLDKKMPEAEPRRGVTLQPNGLMALDDLGILGDLLDEDVIKLPRWEFYHSNGDYI